MKRKEKRQSKREKSWRKRREKTMKEKEQQRKKRKRNSMRKKFPLKRFLRSVVNLRVMRI